MKPRSHGFFNRRYATDHLGNASCPALKDRAKVMPPLRGEGPGTAPALRDKTLGW